MAESLCSYCQVQPAEIATFASDTSAGVSYICASCLHRAELQNCISVPCSCVQFTQERAAINPEELERRGHGLNTQLSEYQDRVKSEAQSVRNRYKEAFAQLNQVLRAAQDRVRTLIDECEATEVERVNALRGDLSQVLDCGSLRTDSAYLASLLNQYDGSPLPEFLTVPSHLEAYVSEVAQFPDPVLSPSHMSAPHSKTYRLIEGNMLIMPIDKQNVVIVDFSGSNVLHKVYPCSTKVPYRAYGRWCRVSDTVYLYTGGRYRGEALKWCDFIHTNHLTDLQQVDRVQGRDMLLSRSRHALVCTGSRVYAFGGCWDIPKDQRRGKGIECLSLESGDWAKANWEANGDLEEVSDLTATVIGSSIYLAGNSRSIYKYDTVSHTCAAVCITSLLDLRLNSETRRVADPVCPLPRQSSNTLILAWEAQIMVLQHDSVFHFTPGAGEVTMSKKKLGVAKPWCSPFPAVVKDSKCYFMLEPTDDDRMPSNQVWTFDFLKKTVNLAQIHQSS